MACEPVDLSAHINHTITRGHPADFPVRLAPVFVEEADGHAPVPHRLAVVREDTGRPVAVVSDRYKVVRHQEILDTVEGALGLLDIGTVPRGIYVDRGGARMRALFKFPALAEAVLGEDRICPCLKIQNTYDGTSRVAIHIGAFRFVCTNLAVGGGGVFAGGFMAVHAGEIPLEQVAEQLAEYLRSFTQIVRLYRRWSETPLDWETVMRILATMRERTANRILESMQERACASVYDAYNVATHHATHSMRSARTAFDLLGLVNREFQNAFPAPAA